MTAFTRDLSRGAFTYAPPALPLLLRAVEIDQRFRGLGLGLVDASIVALAEELGITRLATRDVRHFSSVRLHNGKSFELVVHPGRPDGGD